MAESELYNFSLICHHFFLILDKLNIYYSLRNIQSMDMIDKRKSMF